MSRPVAEIDGAGLGRERFGQIIARCQPIILRDLVCDWPVRIAGERPGDLRAYLGRFDSGAMLEALVGAPQIKGRYYYESGVDGFNFERRMMRLSDALDSILISPRSAEAPSIYAGSLPAEAYMPGFAAENRLDLIDPRIEPRLWIGHDAVIAAHYDALDSLACVVAGQRRFTLYAPELIARLYVGPIDKTMAGQPVSLAASASPDDEDRYPLFRGLRDTALVAALGPGDVLYIPKLWWHQVESTAPVNALVNYWWDAFRAGPDPPYATLLFAMIAIGERPAPERAAWRAFFDHYVFRSAGHPLAHLATERHGLLGPLKDNYGKLRAHVMRALRAVR
jgi:hypothetical protein